MYILGTYIYYYASSCKVFVWSIILYFYYPAVLRLSKADYLYVNSLLVLKSGFGEPIASFF